MTSLQINTPYSIRLGVVGAGTMGSGIALVALLSDMFVTLYDTSPQMLERAAAYIDTHLAKKNQTAERANLNLTTELSAFRGAGVIIEAIPEDLALKQELFARLDELCPPPAILTTNTSTLPVTAIAAATAFPQRVAGMHFFNPAPVMQLVEIIRGAQSDPDVIQSLSRLAELLGKTPVLARDTPGFIVNRVARPFYGEALRIVGEGAATFEQVDRLLRLGGGFRMGPFQLMDLIGIDVNLAAMQSMYEQTFGEPRYRPHHLQMQMVQQRALGRKTKRGFYSYPSQESLPVSATPDPRLQDPKPPSIHPTPRDIVLVHGSFAPGLPALARQAGCRLRTPEMSNGEFQPELGIMAAGSGEGLRLRLRELEGVLPEDVPLFCQCADITLTEVATWLETPHRLVGFDGLFLAGGKAATLVASPVLIPQARQAAEEFIRSLGRLPEWIDDSPGLVLPRMVAMLANEAAFAVGEGVADMRQVDQAMQLGLNYPRGPLDWARQLGYTQILAVLDHLQREFGDDRYRPAPLLRRWERLARVSV